MNNAVPDAHDLTPRYFRVIVSQLRRKPIDGFTDDSQMMQQRRLRNLRPRNEFPDVAATIDSIFRAASWMSSRNEESRRVDKLRLCQNFGTYPRLQTGLRHQIYLAPDQAFQLFAQKSKLDQANPGVRLKVDHDVHIALGPQIPAGGRPEDSEFPDAIPFAYLRDTVGRQFDTRTQGHLAPPPVLCRNPQAKERRELPAMPDYWLLTQPVQVLHQRRAFVGVQFAVAVLIECLEHSFQHLQFALGNTGRQVVDAIAFRQKRFQVRGPDLAPESGHIGRRRQRHAQEQGGHLVLGLFTPGHQI